MNGIACKRLPKGNEIGMPAFLICPNAANVAQVKFAQIDESMIMER